jgi:hypothetical protein
MTDEGKYSAKLFFDFTENNENQTSFIQGLITNEGKMEQEL